MGQLGSLGLFLTLSFVLPGLVIYSSIYLLFPEVRIFIDGLNAFQSFAAIIVISFFQGHPAFIAEIKLLNPIWKKLYSNYKLDRPGHELNRTRIIALAESHNIIHNQFDQIIGEFILYTNTSLWVLVIVLYSFFYDHSNSPPLVVSLIMLLITLIALFMVCPKFKKSYLDILEIILEQLKKIEENETEEKQG